MLGTVNLLSKGHRTAEPSTVTQQNSGGFSPGNTRLCLEHTRPCDTILDAGGVVAASVEKVLRLIAGGEETFARRTGLKRIICRSPVDSIFGTVKEQSALRHAVFTVRDQHHPMSSPTHGSARRP